MKRFLSSFMFACMALVIAVAAGIASSATGEVKVNVTVVDYDQADVALYDAEADQWMSGYNTITDGQVAMGRTDWGANKITYVGVDASSLEGLVMKATLKCEISGSTDNKRNCAFGVGYNNSEWSADMTYNTADKSITLLGGTVGSASKSSTAFNEVSFDVTDAFKDGKVKTLIIYETAAAGGFVRNISVEIETADSELDVVKGKALSKVESLPVGDGLFVYKAADIDAYKAAVNAATTVEEINAVAMPEMTKPKAGKQYKMPNVTAEGTFLGEAKLSAEAEPIVFEEAEGGYYIKVRDNYLNMAGGNTWSMNATETATTVWNIIPTDGAYSIKGPNGLVGADNKDAGSATYGNKGVANNGLWQIEAFSNDPEPEPDTTYPIDMTDKMVNAVCAGTKGTSGANGWTITGNGNPPYLYGDFFENWNGTPANAKFDYYQVVTGLPTGKYTVSAEIQYDGAAGDNEVGAYASTSADEVHGGNKAGAAGFNEYATPEILVTDGTLRIGLKTLATQTATWTAARNFKLTMTGEISLDDFKKMYETAKAQITEELLDTMMNFQIRMELMALNEAAEPTTQEGYLSAINTINDKVAEANKSAKFYNDFSKKYDEIGKVELDKAGEAAALAYPGMGEAIAAWATGSLDETVDYISLLDSAIITGVKGQGAGTDMTLAMPATWEGANGKYGDRPERYYDAKAGSPVAADVMTQTITGLQAGEYEVTFEAAVNFTDGRGIDGHAATKEDSVSVVFAQDVQVAVEVVSQTACSDFPEYTFKATVGEDGVLKYGIYNIDKGANWFVAAAKKLVYLGVPAAPAEPVVDTDLTADMFKNWSSYDASATVVGNAGCAYEVGVSSGMPYGDGNVDMLNYADLKDYKFLVITATAGTPRPLFNRDTKDGQAPDHLIDIPNNADQTAKYQVTIDGENGEKIYYVKLSEILNDYGYVHLLCVKGANWANVTVTGMKLLVDGEIPENPTAVNGVAEVAANAGVKKVVKDGKVIIVKDGKEISADGTM